MKGREGRGKHSGFIHSQVKTGSKHDVTLDLGDAWREEKIHGIIRNTEFQLFFFKIGSRVCEPDAV